MYNFKIRINASINAVPFSNYPNDNPYLNISLCVNKIPRYIAVE